MHHFENILNTGWFSILKTMTNYAVISSDRKIIDIKGYGTHVYYIMDNI